VVEAVEVLHPLIEETLRLGVLRRDGPVKMAEARLEGDWFLVVRSHVIGLREQRRRNDQGKKENAEQTHCGLLKNS
jgi:hypothetical protein